MIRIDSIRMKARHAANRFEEGQATYFNPWLRPTRTNSTQRLTDVENDAPDRPNLPRGDHSTGCIEEEGEHSRGIGSKEGQQEFGVPPHAGTAPGSAVGGAKELQNGYDSQSPTATSQTLNGAGEPTGMRKRTLLQKMGLKKSPEAEEEPKKMEKRASTGGSKKHPKLTIGGQLKTVLFGSYINILLLVVPVGFAVNYSHQQGVVIFVVNFIAIIPLAALLSYATEELALHVGETLGGLLNASFGNAVELIVGIQSLFKDEITITKTSLIGSMLSNLLLVMGMCFFFGGLNKLEQFFNVTVAQTAASLLALCIGSLIIPTVFHMTFEDAITNVEELSRGTAILLLVVYGCYLFFQLKSHTEMYNEPSQAATKRAGHHEKGAAARGIAQIGAGTAAATGGGVNKEMNVGDGNEEEEKEVPKLSVLFALATLAASTTMVAFCSEFMVDSINAITANGGVSETFVGLILLPIVGNAAEHATAVTVAVKDKMDLAIGVAVGSSMQIALLVLPLVVVIAWIGGKDCMTLYFDGFQIAVLFVAIILVNYLIQDGKSRK